MKGTFEEILKFYGTHDLEFDAVIGDVDMPATYCFSGTPKFTDYCKEKFGDLLKANAVVRQDPTGHYTDVVIVDYDDNKIGRQFTMAMAGYISDSEYNKLFQEA